MTLAANLGFPRMGARRELKKALEDHWAGRMSEADLLKTAASLRREHILLQNRLGLGSIPSNDFSLYDQVLDAAALVGAVPSRYGWSRPPVDLRTYFAMARGIQDGGPGGPGGPGGIGGGAGGGRDLPAMEMTKWFDTNYHYIVPEFEPGRRFEIASSKPVEEFREAKALGVLTRPVLLGPVSFLLLGKSKGPGLRPLALLDALLPAYAGVLALLAGAGAAWVQIDEPCLGQDLPAEAHEALKKAYANLSAAAPGLRILLAAYFEGLRDNLATALRLPVSALHLDLVRAPAEIDRVLREAPAHLTLSLGVVDGRNIWRADLDKALGLVERAAGTLGPERVQVAPSCSLLHVPVDLALETDLDDELRGWLAFAVQKLEEVVTLARAVGTGRESVRDALDSSREAAARRRSSPRIHDDEVRRRLAAVTPEMLRRGSPYPARRVLQEKALRLPVFPTTTIGSFPQTAEVRAARAKFRSGETRREEYEAYLREETGRAIRFQEEVGLDVLVHGEFERNDMVEYFGEKLRGFAFTRQGWVQSYGSRCVKPPIIFGDVKRPGPMTVEWARYAQSLTAKPMKGMLTGPSTILQWSFVRDDQPRAVTRAQIALAIRDEARDLEAAGIRAIQIDEPALREGLPLRRADWDEYLSAAVDAFRLASSGVSDRTQVHTHMCYAEFNDIMERIGAMDADVISMETSRSQMELLDGFRRFPYPNEVGPGVYDIHSPRVPSRVEIERLLRKALEVLKPEQLWVNPDCGLKTRRWEEVRPALAAMVEAARALRASTQRS